jgi:hypothetical protein
MAHFHAGNENDRKLLQCMSALLAQSAVNPIRRREQLHAFGAFAGRSWRRKSTITIATM